MAKLTKLSFCQKLIFWHQTSSHKCFLFVLGFYGPVNNEVMSSRSVYSGTVPGQA